MDLAVPGGPRAGWATRRPRATGLLALALLLRAGAALASADAPEATSPPAAPAAGHAAPRRPRSSIAAVLLRSGELGLDADEVRALEDRDERLEQETAALRRRLAAPAARARPGEGRPGPRGGDAAEAPRSPLSSAHPEGGGGGGGGRRGGGMGGGGRHGGEHAAQRPERTPSDLLRQLDDADTAAWLAAEAVLRPAQRDPARAVAEAYREALADEREASRRGAAPPPGHPPSP